VQDAVLDLLSEHREGLTNAQIANQLGLQSDFEGIIKASSHGLSWEFLLNANKAERRGRRYCRRGQ
jgi:hypothetical protein